MRKVEQIKAGCPWADWARPNVMYCEPNVCAWVTTPANTYTNFAYILIGFWMLYDAKTRIKNAGPTLYSVGIANIFVGISSMLYHASFTLFF